MKTIQQLRVVTGNQVPDQPTLVYDRSDGYSWFRPAGEKYQHVAWECHRFTAIGALEAAQSNGLEPEAIYYV